MPTSAAGSNQPAAACRSLRPIEAPGVCARRWTVHRGVRFSGFTLIELMVVVALIAVATAGAVLSLRDSASAALERDAQRLAAVLESARAQARASDATVVWQAHETGFVLRGLPRPESPQTWLSPDTRSLGQTPVVLGPEALIPPQRIELYSATQARQRLWVATDGLRPFEVQRAAQAGTP